MIVAWLPGACGATVVPLTGAGDRPLRIVLPPPIRPVRGRNSQFRVLAAYEGKGKIDGLLSVDVNMEADGSFMLAGVTSGTYRVQATMDGVWLSETTRLIVKADAAPSEAITLDVGEPGPAWSTFPAGSRQA